MNLEAMMESKQMIERWADLRRREPHLGQRDCAARLGVTEAELVAAHVGRDTVRLGRDWEGTLRWLGAIGPVTASTRSEHAVIEQGGTYVRVDIEGARARVTGGGIDLRVVPSRWHVAFAVTAEAKGGLQRSLQFFDATGTATHKVFLRGDSNAEEFDTLVDLHESADQSPTQDVTIAAARAADRLDHEVDTAALLAGWETLGDPLEIQSAIDSLRVTRSQAFRLAGARLAERVPTASYRIVLKEVAASALPIAVVVANAGVAQCHGGRVDIVKQVDGWFNVLDPDFNLHIDERGIESTWVVRGLDRKGVGLHLELHDNAGALAVCLFLQDHARARDSRRWQGLLSAVARPADCVRVCRDIASAVNQPAPIRRAR